MRIILLGLLLLGLVAVNLYVSHNHTSERQSKHLLWRNGLDFENPDEEKAIPQAQSILRSPKNRPVAFTWAIEWTDRSGRSIL